MLNGLVSFLDSDPWPSFGYITDKVGEVVGKKLRTVLEAGSHLDKFAWSKWLRVQVCVNVTKPLKKWCWLSLTDGRCRWVTFRIGKMSDFCFVCGCLNHLE
ncbi:hypothetical protein PTKIN_Ptkin02bG0094300 [Pterospermum kingtungense]